MKKLLIALLVSGIATSAMARYGIYPVKLNGKFIEGKEDSAKYIYNGEVEEMWNGPKLGYGKLRGYLVEDEELDDAWIFTKEDGEWMQIPVSFDVDWYEKLINEKSNEDHYKWSEKGMVTVWLYADLGDDVELWVNMIGSYKYSESENGEYKWQMALVAKGAGEGEQYDDLLDEDVGVAVKYAKIKFNNKASHKMSDAYYEEYDATEGDEEAAVAAAEGWLADFLGGESDPELPLDED